MRAVLAEEFRGVEGRRARIEVFEDARGVVVAGRVSNGARPSGGWHFAHTYRADLVVADPARALYDGRRSMAFGWDLESPDGVIGELGHQVLHDLSCDSAPPASCVHLITALLVFAAERAARLCEPHARDLARMLHPEVRFAAYSALLADPRGWIAQLARTAPAVFSVAAAASPALATELFAAVRRGDKLASVLELALASRHRSPLTMTLLRRAPSLAIGDMQALLDAPGLDASDVPRTADAPAWFDVVLRWAQRAAAIGEPTMAASVGGFVSKHALSLRCDPATKIGIGELCDWVSYGNGRVCRKSSPRRVRREIDAWHEAIATGIGWSGDLLLPAPPRATRVEGVELSPITTVGALIDESNAMMHCAAMYASAAHAGVIWFFGGSVGDQRLTVAVSRGPQGWELVEACGYRNSELQPSSARTLERWVRGLT